MALRAFRFNPSLGGFGGESNNVSEQDCDAFAQIVKELVDNAVDACNSSSTTAADDDNEEPKRVRVVIEPVQDESSDDYDVLEDVDLLDSNVPLRVTVSDNGCGMDNIQDCVEAWQSSKAQNDTTNDDSNSNANVETAGRYGIGLTLCLLHAQRLVPNSCASITSATVASPRFTRASYVVDTDGDKVQCVKQELLPKNSPTESGTAVSLLVPGGLMAHRAWPRLAEYFARFQLSLGLKCSLQVMAPSLSTLPLFVRSQQEQAKKYKKTMRQAAKEKEESPNKQLRWQEHMSDDDASSDSHHSRTADNNNDDNNKVEAMIAAATTAYLKQGPIPVENVAHSVQRLYRNDINNTPNSPRLEVTMIVYGPSDETAFDEEDSDLESEVGRTEGDVDDDPPTNNNGANMIMVRMVNRIPLLDGAEAAACGLVRGVASKALQKAWNSFGLHVSATESQTTGESDEPRLFISSYSVRDSDHVMPFFQAGTHALFEDDDDDDDEEEEPDSEDDDSGGDDNDDSHQQRKRKRTRKKKSSVLLPAHLRLGNILLLVQINADPSTLPLPTLSKGRLPLNNAPIQKALERGVADCCKRLQTTNPALLLTPKQLKTTVRDVRYIPAVAVALACISCQSNDPDFSSQTRNIITSWKKSGDGEARISNNDEGEGRLDRVEALGPLLEKQIRLACWNHTAARKEARKKKRGSPSRRSKRANQSQGDDDAFVNSNLLYEDNDDENEQPSQQEEEENTPPRATRNKLVTPSTGNTSLDSWSSRSLHSDVEEPDSVPRGGGSPPGGKILTREEDDYEDSDWW